jgi:hypothetical protein
VSKLITTDISKYYESLDDAKEDGSIIKCNSVLQFYKLSGKKTVIARENMEPILYLLYLLDSRIENRFYLKCFRNYSLESLFYSNINSKFTHDEAIEQLKRRIMDGNIYILMNAKQVEDIKAMLIRVSKANLSSDGLIRYVDYIRLCEVSLKRERHAEYNKSKDNYKTQLSLYDQQITQTWQNVKR